MDINRPICHEAGHVVAALHLGFRVERIDVHQGMPRSLIAMDCTREMMVVLASGIAAEQLVLGDYDVEGSTDDQKKISECGGGAIENYLVEACDIIRSNECCARRLRERLTRRWIESQAESEASSNFHADSGSLTFNLMSREDIEAIWAEAVLGRSAPIDPTARSSKWPD